MWSALGNVLSVLLLAADIPNSVRPSACSMVQSQAVPCSKSHPKVGSGGAKVVAVVVVVGVGACVVVATAGKTEKRSYWIYKFI